MKHTLTPRELLKTTATQDGAVAKGFGKLIMHYRLNDREEDARLIEALFVLYQRQFQQHLHDSYAQFDLNIRRGDEFVGILCKRIDFKSEERTICDQVSQGMRCADCLRLFNRGERKYFKAGSDIMICRRCYENESSCEVERSAPAEISRKEGVL